MILPRRLFLRSLGASLLIASPAVIAAERLMKLPAPLPKPRPLAFKPGDVIEMVHDPLPEPRYWLRVNHDGPWKEIYPHTDGALILGEVEPPKVEIQKPPLYNSFSFKMPDGFKWIGD